MFTQVCLLAGLLWKFRQKDPEPPELGPALLFFRNKTQKKSRLIGNFGGLGVGPNLAVTGKICLRCLRSRPALMNTWSIPRVVALLGKGDRRQTESGWSVTLSWGCFQGVSGAFPEYHFEILRVLPTHPDLWWPNVGPLLEWDEVAWPQQQAGRRGFFAKSLWLIGFQTGLAQTVSEWTSPTFRKLEAICSCTRGNWGNEGKTKEKARNKRKRAKRMGKSPANPSTPTPLRTSQLRLKSSLSWGIQASLMELFYVLATQFTCHFCLESSETRLSWCSIASPRTRHPAPTSSLLDCLRKSQQHRFISYKAWPIVKRVNSDQCYHLKTPERQNNSSDPNMTQKWLGGSTPKWLRKGSKWLESDSKPFHFILPLLTTLRKWGVRSVVVGFGVFGAPQFSVQRSPNTYF